MKESIEHILTVGDSVMWRGAWGQDPAKETVLDVIEADADLDDRAGTRVESLPWSRVPRSILTITNGHWAYCYQISPFRAREIPIEKITDSDI
jgi:hypothetical protein